MKFHELTAGRTAGKRRVGRGISAGRGKTAGRGTKGQNSRAGGPRRPGFEGGQNPLMSRLPKLRGFTSYRAKAQTVYTGQLNDMTAKTVDNFTLAEAGLIASPFSPTKLISKGKLEKAVTVNLQAASVSAVEAVGAAGGSFTKTDLPKRPVTKTDKPTKTE